MLEPSPELCEALYSTPRGVAWGSRHGSSATCWPYTAAQPRLCFLDVGRTDEVSRQGTSFACIWKSHAGLFCDLALRGIARPGDSSRSECVLLSCRAVLATGHGGRASYDLLCASPHLAAPLLRSWGRGNIFVDVHGRARCTTLYFCLLTCLFSELDCITFCHAITYARTCAPALANVLCTKQYHDHSIIALAQLTPIVDARSPEFVRH